MERPVFNKTKVVATVGPASSSKSLLRELVLAGVDLFRLNFSHSTHEQHQTVISHIREINDELKTYVSILQDLQGPKIRIEEVENNRIELKVGEIIKITSERVLGTNKKVSTSFKSLATDVKVGDPILLDDGNLELKVINKNNGEVEAEVVHGGILRSKKGINLPTTHVSVPSLTEKDHEDLLFGLENDVDWVALSFVRSAEDVKKLKKIIAEQGKETRVIAKIEKPEAVNNIDEIIKVTDALMVARGDLGVEIPMERVPMVQKDIINKCNIAAKPVIVATQMLESMIRNPRPTRAEASDVANAILDGADAVMLSGESAMGSYPVLAVKSMVRIIKSIEMNALQIYNKNLKADPKSETFYHDNVLVGACVIARDTCAKVITGITFSGYTAFALSKHRPYANIYIFSENKKLLNQINLIWGVQGFYYDKFKSTDHSIDDTLEILKSEGIVKKGDVVIHTGTLPVIRKKRTNMVRLTEVE
ncbi:MAG: pyruvate kinase [Candidatus Cyclobacteriaceae bacterium M3_2C_046]